MERKILSLSAALGQKTGPHGEQVIRSPTEDEIVNEAWPLVAGILEEFLIQGMPKPPSMAVREALWAALFLRSGDLNDWVGAELPSFTNYDADGFEEDIVYPDGSVLRFNEEDSSELLILTEGEWVPFSNVVTPELLDCLLKVVHAAGAYLFREQGEQAEE